MGYVIEDATADDVATWKNAAQLGIVKAVTFRSSEGKICIEIEPMPAMLQAEANRDFYERIVPLLSESATVKGRR